jgi:hypothetical protein
MYTKQEIKFDKKEFDGFTSYFHNYILAKSVETGRVYQMPYDAGYIATLTYASVDTKNFNFLDLMDTEKATEYKKLLMLSNRVPRISYLRVKNIAKEYNLDKSDYFSMDYLKTENMKTFRRTVDIDNFNVFQTYLQKKHLPKLVYVPKSIKTKA